MGFFCSIPCNNISWQLGWYPNVRLWISRLELQTSFWTDSMVHQDAIGLIIDQFCFPSSIFHILSVCLTFFLCMIGLRVHVCVCVRESTQVCACEWVKWRACVHVGRCDHWVLFANFIPPFSSPLKIFELFSKSIIFWLIKNNDSKIDFLRSCLIQQIVSKMYRSSKFFDPQLAPITFFEMLVLYNHSWKTLQVKSKKILINHFGVKKKEACTSEVWVILRVFSWVSQRKERITAHLFL